MSEETSKITPSEVATTPGHGKQTSVENVETTGSPNSPSSEKPDKTQDPNQQNPAA